MPQALVCAVQKHHCFFSLAQEIVEDTAPLVIKPTPQYNQGDRVCTSKFEIKFSQIYLSKPKEVGPRHGMYIVYPNEARLRKLTYRSRLYVDIEVGSNCARPLLLTTLPFVVRTCRSKSSISLVALVYFKVVRRLASV